MLYKKAINFYKMFSTFELKSLFLFYKLKYLNKQNNDTHYFRIKNGLKVSANKSAGDLTTLFEIFINGDYEFEGNSEEKFNILDIGANVGYFSLYISKRFPNAKVYSFEPFRDTYNRLVENINENSAKNIASYQLAVSDFNGTANFFTFDWAGCNTLIDREFESGHYNTTSVDCISFDDIFAKTGVKEFRFGKIDCEGSEYNIFLNSRDESICSVKNYIIEVHKDSKYSKQDLMSRFEKLDYKVIDKENMIEASLI